LCVIDRVPRKLDAQQEALLQLLSQQVMAQLVMRRSILELREALEERERVEKRLERAIKRAQRGDKTRSRLLLDLNRDLQEAATSLGTAADHLAAGARAGRKSREAESLRLLAKTLTARCRKILRLSGTK
jgi:hypothetical protein